MVARQRAKPEPIRATAQAETRRKAEPPRPRERDLIARWGTGAWRGWTLVAADGGRYTVLYQGRPGGPAGPDFRDAVLMDGVGARLTGDIELHLSPAGWRAHGHSVDPRYNDVALHVTLSAGRGAAACASLLASGRRVPLVALAEQEPRTAPAPPPWPCQRAAVGHGAAHMRAMKQRTLLITAGWARFDERVAPLSAALAPVSSPGAGVPGWTRADALLFAGVAEGLAYGRDRATLRACGERLAGGEPADALLTTALRMPVVERRRLAGLLILLERWRERGPVAALAGALRAGAERAGAAGAAHALTEAMRAREEDAVSAGRARILAFNVALPMMVAWGSASSGDGSVLARLARSATEALPGLPSNQITREMRRQLGLSRLPSGALAQQGLHHLWATHCREKRCDACPCACW
ncbi:MAG TPA: DUF2851 family protein [Ktedonobacterales bacterium]|nr:DUF2851 family protein [Ktedonobacterales bacterium]